MILSWLTWLAVSFLLYWIFNPLIQLLRLKLKYGNKVVIFYFPILGIFARFAIDLKKHRDVYYSFKRLMADYPEAKIYASHLPTGQLDINLLDATLLKEVFLNPEAIKKASSITFSDLFVKAGLVFTNKHKQQRQFLGQLFTYEALKSMIPSIKSQTQRIFSQQIQDGKPSNISDITKLITGTIVSQKFFGYQNEEEYEDFVKFINQTDTIFESSFLHPWVSFRNIIFGNQHNEIPSYLLLSFEKDNLKYLKNLNEQVNKKIDNRNEQIKEQKVNSDDILTQYVIQLNNPQSGVNRDEIIHQYFTMLIAGIDTTSTNTVTAMMALAKNKDIQDKLRQSIKDVIQDYENLNAVNINSVTYLNNFIQEVLRYYSVGSRLFQRYATSDIKIGDFNFTKGTYFDIFFIIGNFNSKLFADPYEFNVDRWNNIQLEPFAFTPFSAGKANCIGQHMAVMELKIFIIYLVLNYEVELARQDFSYNLKLLYQPIEKDVVTFRKIK